MKIYKMNLKNSRTLNLSAKHNKEAMERAGKYTQETGIDIENVKDEYGNIIIQN